MLSLTARNGSAHNDLAHGSPLVALRAHAALLRAPQRTAEGDSLRSVVEAGDRFARALAISDRIACLNLTLHYHDVPEHLPADLVYRMFSCDLEAFGLGGSCGNPEHQHAHVKPAETVTRQS